ncbi:uncharacterized protein LOC132698203 [Cylas formicarius]|uniref:uncharacterized protein LOC132698203 n=1 Tax=Cylas formicarius TaxID=197179 RepID=UPI0029587038|nr:uncharacterized protein LOC132698203 [Cylas formicarius]
MADEIAKRNFSHILTNVGRKFDILQTKWTGNKLFEAKFRTEIPRNNDDYNTLCDQWVDLFSQMTNTVWVKKISNTGPKIRFRKQYQCWTQPEQIIKKELLFDARRCRATIDLKVLADSPQSRKKLKHLRIGLNVVVKMNFSHLHELDTSKDFAFFVHLCEPLPEVPKQAVQPNPMLPQLVAKMVEKGPITSRKAAERAEEAVKRQCLQSSFQSKPLMDSTLNTSTPTVQILQNVPLNNVTTDNLNPKNQSYTQIVVNSPDGQATETFLMCQQLMFDASSQIIQEVIPLTTSSLAGDTYIQVQIPDLNGGTL